MTDIALRVENLGKLYHIGARQEQYRTLRSVLVSGFNSLVTRRLKTGVNKGTLWALKDVSFDVKQGEVLGVIGRNGAGKSTLLKILGHITEPTEGRVSLYGRVGSLLEVGTGFHPELTGRDNIYLNGAILGMSRTEINRKFDDIVDFAEIEKFLDTPVKHYSSGMYVRLAFAVAVHLDPEILLVDEVLAVGDMTFQKKSLGKLSSVANEGRTVLLVSHNLAAIQHMTHRTLVLQSGLLKYSGETDDAIQQYAMDNTDLKSIRLSDRSDRTGIAPGTLQGIRLYSSSKPVDVAITGLPLEIEVDYLSERDSPLDFFVAFYDAFERRVIHMNTIMSGLTGKPRAGTGTVKCTIAKLPLAPGTYHLAVAVDRAGVTLDRIEHAYELSISMGDFYETGRIVGSDWGMFLVENHWEIK